MTEHIGPYEIDSVTCADAIAFLAALPDACADAVVTDPPYGTTACAWDTVVPFEPMWEQLRRIVKPRAAIVMTASQPFTSRLVMSNLEMFRYAWVWDKLAVTGYLDAGRKPLKRHEDVLVFCDSAAPYYPQMRHASPYKHKENGGTKVYHRALPTATINDGLRYPTSIVTFNNANTSDTVHPTQKPVALFAYLIRTYTQPGALVIDPFAGSGTTGVAARDLGRHFLLNDITPEYVAIAQERLAAPYTPPLFLDAPGTPRAAQMPLDLTGDD
jgi:site-specific DNA-methyltransferase (adenine-specific)